MGQIKHQSSEFNVRSLSYIKLKSVVEEPTLFNPTLVAECQHEIEIRDKSVALKSKVAEFDSQRLRDVLRTPSMYAEELVYACQVELSNRGEEYHEEEKVSAPNQVSGESQKDVNDNNVLMMRLGIGGLAVAIISIVVVFIVLLTPSKKVQDDDWYNESSRGSYVPRVTHQHSAGVSSQEEELNGDYFPPGRYPLASLRYLTPSDLYGMSKWELKIMRNEILARYGYIFKTSAMINYFSSQSWYRPEYTDVSSMITPMEWQNIELIKEFEKM
jgi:hypothetical protein